MGLAGCANSANNSSAKPGNGSEDLSSELGQKAGEYLVYEDPFYDPQGTFANMATLCRKNFEIDESKASNFSLYVKSCEDVILSAYEEWLFGDTSEQEGSNPESNEQQGNNPESGDSTTTPQKPEPEIRYWKPTVQNMLSCSKVENDKCVTLASNKNTFGKNSLQLAKQLIDVGICSKLLTEGLNFPNSETIAECEVLYEGESAGSATIRTGDDHIRNTLRSPINGFSSFKALMKDGLIIYINYSDMEEVLLNQISGKFGGEVLSVG